MAEISFPILEKPLSDTQWKSVARGFGTGVMDEGGNPYNLTNLNNATNTATIAVDNLTGYNHAVISGFFHKMDAPVTISLPAVTRTTTYHVALMYDPLNKAMPVKLAVVTTLDRQRGKDYLVLWEVTRQPNQLLTEATKVKKRPTIAPTILVDTPASLPDARAQLWGTRAFAQQTGEEFRASYDGTWVPISPHRVALTQPPGWQVNSPTYGLQVTPTSGGLHVHVGISPIRKSAPYTVGTSFSVMGTVIPAGYRPTENIYALATMGDVVHEIRIDASGALAIRGRGQGFTFPRDGSFATHVSWFVPKAY